MLPFGFSRVTPKRLLSIVIPVYNERENVEPLLQALSAVMTNIEDRYDYELIFTDNHSSDGTFNKLKEMAKSDSRIRVLRFSKNVGYQRSILTGYIHARGDAAIQIDGDLQDPPEVIPDFIDKWENGYQVVYGVRVKRSDGVIASAIRKGYYRILAKFSDDDIPLDTGEFRLIDKKIIAELRSVDNVRPYLRGLVATMGFNQIGVPYERVARDAGESKFLLKDLIKLSVDGFLNHSTVPLRLATMIGLIVSILTLLTGVGFFISKVFFEQEWPRGFATTTILILLSLSIISLLLGVIGEYLSRIYEQLRQSSKVIVEEEIGNIEDKTLT